MSGAGVPRPPSVERVIAAARPRLGERAHEAIVREARLLVDGERARLAAGDAPRSVEALGAALAEGLERFERAGSHGTPRVVNATGVILHTNLGRAPWPEVAIRAAAEVAAGYAFVELDRGSGRRGRRGERVVEHLRALTGAEDALVVTNAAAALALAVGLAGRRGGVAVSRGELVEIGGGVRIPEIVRRAGARLVEVGTTNRTRPEDFGAVLTEGAATLVLRVHPSNFSMEGFVESADHAAVAALAHRHGALVVDDVGSGALLDTSSLGLPHEPMPGERLMAGADVVCFSGDKLLGGPQAGVLVGSAAAIGRLRKDPLARALRPDKTILAALEATLGCYRAGRALETIPVWRMAAAPLATLRARAEAVAARLGPGVADVVASEATLGGGSLPGSGIPSVALSLRSPSPDALAARLRAGDPPIVGRVEDGALLLDLRTVDPADGDALAAAVAAALADGRGPRG